MIDTKTFQVQLLERHQERTVCVAGQAVDAFVSSGSDYPTAIAIGSEVQMELELDTGLVLVTRGAGTVKLGYLVGPAADRVRRCLNRGQRCTGEIVDVLRHPRGKLMRIELRRSRSRGE